MAMRFNPPPNWPPPPEGFVPQPGWRPDPGWPPPPAGWQLWVSDDQADDAAGGLTPGYIGYGPPSPGTSSWPGQPAAGLPGYPQPGMPAWGPAAPPPGPGTSGTAVAAFVLGLLGFFGISAILGIVFGCVALGRIRWSRQGGKGLAIAGIVLGSGWLVLYITLIVIGAATGVSTSASGTGAPPLPSVPAGSGSRTVDIFSLVTGDCFDNPTPAPGQQQNVTSVVQTPCSQPHNAQIFATFSVSGSLLHYPGEATMRSLANSGCAARVKASLDAARVTNAMTVRYLFPLEGSWLGGRRTISCIVYNPTPTLRSSLLKS